MYGSIVTISIAEYHVACTRYRHILLVIISVVIVSLVSLGWVAIVFTHILFSLLMLQWKQYQLCGGLKFPSRVFCICTFNDQIKYFHNTHSFIATEACAVETKTTKCAACKIHPRYTHEKELEDEENICLLFSLERERETRNQFKYILMTLLTSLMEKVIGSCSTRAEQSFKFFDILTVSPSSCGLLRILTRQRARETINWVRNFRVNLLWWWILVLCNINSHLFSLVFRCGYLAMFGAKYGSRQMSCCKYNVMLVLSLSSIIRFMLTYFSLSQMHRIHLKFMCNLAGSLCGGNETRNLP